jgi:hypothetical protein
VIVDDFKMASNGLDSGTPAEELERRIFLEFTNQIEANLNPQMYTILTQDFSSSTKTSRAVSEVCLMSTMKNHFSYRLMTRCGIPVIELRGTRDDWVSLRQRTESLGSFMTNNSAEIWLSVLLPILDEFIKSYDGEVNSAFWQTMVKFRETPPGSDAYEYIPGWIQDFFPYLDGDSPSRYVRPW